MHDHGNMALERVARPPSCDLGAPDPRRATGRPLRWGVVSTGHMARTMSVTLQQLDDAVIHAVSSRSETSARAFADAFGTPAAYFDGPDQLGYERLAADPAVEVVYVATPHAYHHRVTSALLDAGKHVLVEKAFTVTAPEAEDLIELARERGCFLMEAVWTRFLPVYHRLLEELDHGAVGRPHWAHADLGMVVPFDPKSRLWAREAGGGALLDLGAYALTWTVAALGLPSEVRATGTLAENGVDALAALALRHPSGALAQVLTTLNSCTTGTATIAGSRGVIQTLAPLTHPAGFRIFADREEREIRIEPTAPGYAYQLREVSRCVHEGLPESPTLPLDETLALMRIFDAARNQLGVMYPSDEVAPGPRTPG